MHGERTKQTFTRATLRRIAVFARPHRRALVAFLVLSVISAVLAVATPVLAGWVVDALIKQGSEDRVLVAGRGHRPRRRPRRRGRHRRAVAVVPHRRGADPRPAPGGLRPRAADAGGLLHPHPHRRPRQPAQQRRHRRPAGLHLDAVGRRQQPHHPAAHPGRDAAAVVVDHPAGAGPAAGVRDPRPAHGRPPRPPGAGGGRPQRRHDHPDDRAVLRSRGHAGQALRPARPGGGRVRRPGRAGGPDRRAHRHGPVGVPHRPGGGLGAGPGPRLRPRRLDGAARAGSSPAPS